ncbi:Serine/threonine-protein kinase, partial [Eremomyces bilateralis CBS 781.70]
GATPTEYAQMQQDEIEALKAIYDEDFVLVQNKGAWSKTETGFRLTVRSTVDRETLVILNIAFTATYPKTLPILKLESSQGLRGTPRQRIEEIVKTKPKELLGEVMVYELACSIQEALDDGVQFREDGQALPSFAEQRAEQEAAAQEEARRQEEQSKRRQEEAKEEEQRMLKELVDNELSRQLASRRKSKVFETPELGSSRAMNVIEFDRTISFGQVTFNKVTASTCLRTGPLTEIFMVQPLSLTTGSDDASSLQQISGSNVSSGSRLSRQLVVKRATVIGTGDVKASVLGLEASLETLKGLPRQTNSLEVLEYNISGGADVGAWEVVVLMEYADNGSIDAILRTFGTLPVGRVRSWAADLLEALDYYHRNGVVHGRIHARNILLCESTVGGPATVKLADASYQQSLYETKTTVSPKRSADMAWAAPELRQLDNGHKTRKSDIWDFGVVFLQMLFGLECIQDYESPISLIESKGVSEPFADMVRKIFRLDAKKRPSAFDLLPSEFIRNDIPLLMRLTPPPLSQHSSSASIPQHHGRARPSFSGAPMFSRYASDWAELGRLGKGGYGEVVKARNRMDGRIYAIKKITQSSAALSEVLSEVMLLSQLNHPYVVRYFSAWPEDLPADPSESGDDSFPTLSEASEATSVDVGSNIEFGFSSTGGLDFISSSGFPKIEFAEDSSEDETEEENGSLKRHGNHQIPSDASRSPKQFRRFDKSRNVKTTLYIQMEYCERRTLRDIIRKDISENSDECWKLFRQVLEGLAHIHGLGIIHRDLKPDNIFIDAGNNPKIGDFGLATTGQLHASDRTAADLPDGDMTKSIGTTFYVAPELRSNAGGSYNNKVDMYSLGIIFFEMCHPLKTAMERDKTIRALREKEHSLPQEFSGPAKAVQAGIILSLVSHRPSERPGSAELLRSGKIPLQFEDGTVRIAIDALSDPKSPHHHEMVSAMFAYGPNQKIKDYTWNVERTHTSEAPDSQMTTLQGFVKKRLVSIFKRHGAVEDPRPATFPYSTHYDSNSAVKMMDTSGTLVQLPYDLTLPYARCIARSAPTHDRTFAFARVYRETYVGGAPKFSGEADFDVVSYDTGDSALEEAEVIKVLDEVLDEFPPFASTPMCFHLNHSRLLDLIMTFCRISKPQWHGVKETLSKLNIHQWTWARIRTELRAPALGVSSTSLDDMARFDFRDTPEKAMSKIQKLFDGVDPSLSENLKPVFEHFRALVRCTKQFGVGRKVYICPLSSFNEKFYGGGILFQCIYDSKKRDVLAAGGRYDSLIEEYKPKAQGHFTGCRAVGMNLGWDRIVASMGRYARKMPSKPNYVKKSDSEASVLSQVATRRCDILVSSTRPSILRSTGVKLVADLWANHISAELAIDARTFDELLEHYDGSSHSWIIVIKHDSPHSVQPDLKIRCLARNEDSEIRSSELLSYLRAEYRERDQREGTATASAKAAHMTSTGGRIPVGAAEDRKSNVYVLGSHRGKRSGKWNIVDSALASVQALAASFSSAPIVAVEAKDDTVIEVIRDKTRLSDPDSWRKVIHSMPQTERTYWTQLHELLCQWKEDGQGGEAEVHRAAFLYNWRTGTTAYYDLGQ